MPNTTNMDIYLNNHYEGMTPEKLTQMLYKGALRNLSLAKEGINENNPKKRGEYISKAIAIIAELHSSLNPEMTDELTQFLRSLYSKMLVELPKISINNDIKTLDHIYSHIEKLADIWDNEVMNKNNKKQAPKLKTIKNNGTNSKVAGKGSIKQNNNTIYKGYSELGQKFKAQSIFA